MTQLDRMVEPMDLAEFLEAEQKRIGYRELEDKTNVSRGSLENIIKRKMQKLPELETLQGIAQGFDKPLWEVVQMVIDLGLPQAPTELGKRLAAMVERRPRIARAIERLQELEHKRPDLVVGMLITLEVLDRQLRRRLPPNPPEKEQ